LGTTELKQVGPTSLQQHPSGQMQVPRRVPSCQPRVLGRYNLLLREHIISSASGRYLTIQERNMAASDLWHLCSVNVYNDPPFPPSYSPPPSSPGCHVKKTCDVILLQKSTRGGTQVCCHAQTARRVPTSAAGPSVPPDRSNRVLPIFTNVSALVASPLLCPPHLCSDSNKTALRIDHVI
jgi:hypothetical protein